MKYVYVFNPIRNLYSQPSISHQDPTIHFKVVHLTALFKKAYTGNKSIIYPYDILIFMGPFQLEIFCDSYATLVNIRAREKNKLSAYFSMNKSSNQSFLRCTRKSRHRENKTNRNKWVHSKRCLPKLNIWLCIQSSISKDDIPYVSKGVERNTIQ